MAIVNHAGGYMAPLRGGAGGRARRAIASCAGLFHRFHRLCGRKQRTRLHFVTRTTRGERHGKCGGADVIREFRDNHPSYSPNANQAVWILPPSFSITELT